MTLALAMEGVDVLVWVYVGDCGIVDDLNDLYSYLSMVFYIDSGINKGNLIK